MPQHPEKQTDQELVELLNRGEIRAFDAIYDRYRDWVMRLAWRFTGHHEDALDVLQETFAYLVRKFPGFQLTAAMTTFLYPAVRNLAIAANKKRNRSVGSDGDPDLYESPITAEAQSDASRIEISALLTSLSGAHREILLMRYVDEMTQPEIAAALDLPIGTVKSRLHHAVQALRQLPQIEDALGHNP